MENFSEPAVTSEATDRPGTGRGLVTGSTVPHRGSGSEAEARRFPALLPTAVKVWILVPAVVLLAWLLAPSPEIGSFQYFHLARSAISRTFGLKMHLELSSPSGSSPLSLDQRTSISVKVSKGDMPPPFTLKDQNGRSVSLSQFKGRPIVVYFYPADDTPGCTKQACAFRDSYEKFKKAGAEVIGISGDNPASHKAFTEKYGLPFTLLSDEGNQVRKEWGVPSDFLGLLPGRQTYVLDRKGVVQLIYNSQFQPQKHIDETLKLLEHMN